MSINLLTTQFRGHRQGLFEPLSPLAEHRHCRDANPFHLEGKNLPSSPPALKSLGAIR